MLFLNTSLSLTSFKLSRYKPYINYDWSTTTTSGLRYLKDVGSTPTYNASMYFGRGAYFNGVDQGVSLEGLGVFANVSLINTIVFKASYIRHPKYNMWFKKLTETTAELSYWRSSLYTNIVAFNDKSSYTLICSDKSVYLYKDGLLIFTDINAISFQVKDRFSIGGRANDVYVSGVAKDIFIFNRTLTQSEITQSYEQPELFYAMAQADSTCVLNMPMCETSSTARNYKNGIDYPITNYTTSVRDNAKNLQYGLQTCKFVRDSLGVIQSASDYLECDGGGYVNCGNFLDTQNDFSIEFIGLFKTSSAEQAHGVGAYNAYNRVTFSVDAGGKLFSRCGGTIGYYSMNSLFDTCNYLTLTFIRSTKIFKLYLNGNYVGQVSNSNFTSTIRDYTIGAQGSTTYPVNGDIRLFKVHNKALTQAEITANYNSYQNKGLLS